MCQTVATVRYEKCNDTVEMNLDKAAPFCLFGDQCKEVGYTYKVFRRQSGQCPKCAGKAGATKGLLDGASPEPRVPHYLADKERCIAAARIATKKILEDDKLTDKNCKDLLFYILGLPSWMKKGQLLAAFGYGVYGYYGAEWEQEIVGIAKRKHFDNALVAGMMKKQEEASRK